MSEEIATADANLAYIARLTAERDALLLRCDLLNQAAHEYSESRDRWLLHAREAQRQNATLRKLLGRVPNITGHYAPPDADAMRPYVEQVYGMLVGGAERGRKTG